MTEGEVDPMPGYTVAVAGGKGGVGKTTTTINLAADLAATGTSTLVVEADLAMANLVDFLDLSFDPESDPDLRTVLAGDHPIEAAITETEWGFDVVPSGTPLDRFAAADVERLGAVLADCPEYGVTFVDTGAGLSRETLVPLGVCDVTLLVTTPRVAAVRDTDKTADLADRVGGRVGGVLFVRSGTGGSPPPTVIADFLDVPLVGHVPADPAVPSANDAGEPVLAHAPESDAAAAYRDAAHELEGRLDRIEPTADAERDAAGAVAETRRHRGGFEFVGAAAEADADRSEPPGRDDGRPAGSVAGWGLGDAPSPDGDPAADDSSTPEGGGRPAEPGEGWDWGGDRSPDDDPASDERPTATPDGGSADDDGGGGPIERVVAGLRRAFSN